MRITASLLLILSWICQVCFREIIQDLNQGYTFKEGEAAMTIGFLALAVVLGGSGMTIMLRFKNRGVAWALISLSAILATWVYTLGILLILVLQKRTRGRDARPTSVTHEVTKLFPDHDPKLLQVSLDAQRALDKRIEIENDLFGRSFVDGVFKSMDFAAHERTLVEIESSLESLSALSLSLISSGHYNTEEQLYLQSLLKYIDASKEATTMLTSICSKLNGKIANPGSYSLRSYNTDISDYRSVVDRLTTKGQDLNKLLDRATRTDIESAQEYTEGDDPGTQVRNTIKTLFEDIWPGKEAPDGPEYEHSANLALTILSHFRQEIEDYLLICTGERNDELISPAMSFSRRFLKHKKTSSSREELRDLIARTFYLGFFCHNVTTTMPSRQLFASLNRRYLFAEWRHKSMVSKERMRPFYRQLGNNLVPRLFKEWWLGTVEPKLRENVRLGVWRRGIAASWFENLFLAGGSLGLTIDLETAKSTKSGDHAL